MVSSFSIHHRTDDMLTSSLYVFTRWRRVLPRLGERSSEMNSWLVGFSAAGDGGGQPGEPGPENGEVG